MSVTAENPLPDCYAELHTARYVELGNLRTSIAAECAQTRDSDYMEALAKADEGVAAAQALLQRSANFILEYRLRCEQTGPS